MPRSMVCAAGRPRTGRRRLSAGRRRRGRHRGDGRDLLPMFGPDLLVAPVTRYEARSREVYLPAGTEWTHAWTGRKRASSGSATLT